ncbi:MAG: hypothetical protein U9R42_09140 [Bacteroidota bacterium]|nr:hypothetical protein [Bacteroidota bacterium]
MKLSELSENRIATLLSFLFFMAFCYVSVKFKGTAGAGDSTMHFLFSSYAFAHPENFLDHWAKPLFTLFSAPFAAMGFTVMKIFNSLVASITAYTTYRIAKKMNLKYSLLALLFVFSAPLYFRLIFSGLTEHFFALVLVVAVYLTMDEKYKSSAIIFSFLPFARSEGLVILAVFVIYLIVKKKSKIIPWVFTGHIFYGILGLIFYHHDFLWIFKKIPYAHLSSVYGSGDIFHFFDQMTYVIGGHLYLLLVAGIIMMIISFFIKKLRNNREFYVEELWLIYGAFAAFFIAHSLFWYFGIFNSMGLKRVLIDVVPLIAIICLIALDYLLQLPILQEKHNRYYVLFLIIPSILYFPFSSNKAAIDWDKDLNLNEDQLFIEEVAKFVDDKYFGYKYFYDQSYLSIALDVDHFNSKQHQNVKMLKFDEFLEEESLVIWNSFYSKFNGISYEMLENDLRFKNVKEFRFEKGNKLLRYVLFEYQGEKKE